MGLDAVVFTNVHALRRLYGDFAIYDVDKLTGEVSLQPGLGPKVPRLAFFAVKQSLGNVSEIAELRQSVKRILAPRSSLILDRVLYSSTHSGDVIETAELARLREEAVLLRSSGERSLTEFIASLEVLLAAAAEQKNPIVFV